MTTEKATVQEIPGLFAVENLQDSVLERRAQALGWVASAIVTHNMQTPSELATPKEAWRLLATDDPDGRSQKEIDALHETLLDPPTGGWLAYMIRSFVRHTEKGEPLPHWGHAGYLNAMAAAAASQAGMDFDITVPAWDGFVTLPGLGQAIFEHPSGSQDRWSVARVQGAGDQLIISSSEGAISLPRTGSMPTSGWQPFDSVGVPIASSKETLRLTLDDCNPYRFIDPVAPNDDTNRLSPDQRGMWLTRLTEGVTLLATDHPEFAKQVGGITRTIIPTRDTSIHFRQASASAGDTIGTFQAGVQHDIYDMAETIVHEGHHNLLYAHLLAHDLLPTGDDARRDSLLENLYAPWRDDPRHLYGLLHGVVSFWSVTEFWRQRISKEAPGSPHHKLAQFLVAHWREQLWPAMKQLNDPRKLTEEGSQFVSALQYTHLDRIADEPIPPEIKRLAQRALSYHKSRWTAHHVMIDEDRVATLAAAWDSGNRSLPPRSGSSKWLDFDPMAQRFDTWLVLACMAITNMDDLRALPSEPAALDERIQGAIPADVQYFLGDIDGAAKMYLDALCSSNTFTDTRAIAGLGLILGRDTPAGQILIEWPHIYRAVQQRLFERYETIATPVALAEWLYLSPRSPYSRDMQPRPTGSEFMPTGTSIFPSYRR